MRNKKVKSPRRLVRVKRVGRHRGEHKREARGRKEKGTLEEEDYDRGDRGVGPNPKRAESE